MFGSKLVSLLGNLPRLTEALLRSKDRCLVNYDNGHLLSFALAVLPVIFRHYETIGQALRLLQFGSAGQELHSIALLCCWSFFPFR